MPSDQMTGVVFPRTTDGSRSTSTLGRAVVTAALRQVDPTGAAAAERETNWRSGYLSHFRQLTLAGLADRAAALTVAEQGLAALHDRMRVIDASGEEVGLDHLLRAGAEATPETLTVVGTSPPEEELTVPFRGERLRGDGLRRQLERWAQDGIVEPSFADAIRTVAGNPGWLRLDGRTVVVLGAGAEMGPLPALLRWGATVAGIDLPSPDIWRRVLDTARGGAGTLLAPLAPAEGSDAQVIPVSGEGRAVGEVAAADPASSREGEAASAAGVASEGSSATGDGATPEERAGLDLITQVPAAAAWIAALPGSPVLGNYVYAEGATHVRVAMAVDALTRRLQADRDDLALAFLATPTDVFAVPADDVERASRAYAQRSKTGKLLARPLRALSGGRLLRPAYARDVNPGICDSLVPQQGPNYALAKRIHRWRATVARHDGRVVSMHVAPATRTRSVMKNRALAAAYAGAHRFGVEIFDPGTTNTLMAALLVHDLHTGGGPTHDHVWQDEAHAAAHGGLWTCAYAPRSALGLAAVLGLGGARH
ncbi:MAG TPA: hypothetical protein VMM13_04765 [Euzebya sp.]|nr:hypothetical protein [Euzebya sp.]